MHSGSNYIYQEDQQDTLYLLLTGTYTEVYQYLMAKCTMRQEEENLNKSRRKCCKAVLFMALNSNSL